MLLWVFLKVLFWAHYSFLYINDLSENVASQVKPFADDTSIFQVVSDVNLSWQSLSSDLSIIQDWAYRWKMSFNPDPSKQAQEVIFSSKRIQDHHPPLSFNDYQINVLNSQKHLGLILDEKLTLSKHVRAAIVKAKKGIGIIRFLSIYAARDTLDQMYKLFVRPHLDYGDVIYHDHNMSLSRKLESIQYEAAMAMNCAWKGNNTDKLLEELGWETLGNRRWHRRLCLIVNNQAPEYLCDYVPDENRNQDQFRHTNVFRNGNSSSKRYSKSLLPYCVNIWSKLDHQIRACSTISQFKTALLSIIRPVRKSLHEIRNRHHSALIIRL